MGVVTEVPRQQVAQLDVCVRSRPMCLHAFESGPELAGNTISDLIEPLFRRVKRPNRPIFGEVYVPGHSLGNFWLTQPYVHQFHLPEGVLHGCDQSKCHIKNVD